MGKIQVIFKKEDIRPEDLKGKVVVVFDILFATSTITAAIADGAASVIPVYSPEQARETAKNFPHPFLMAGEDQGKRIDGFHPPLRTHLNPVIPNKHLILTTTNGTVALHQSRKASHLYAASLLNNPAMARFLKKYHHKETIVLVCSGSSGRYTIEDFYGAGSLINHLLRQGEWELSDAAATALHFYKGCDEAREVLRNCRIGRLLVEAGLNPQEIDFVAKEGLFNTVLAYNNKNGQIKEVRDATC